MLRYGYNEKVEDEAVELLLTSIQAKMGIIDIGKEKLTSKHWIFHLLIFNWKPYFYLIEFKTKY